jgi:hypothetical protein
MLVVEGLGGSVKVDGDLEGLRMVRERLERAEREAR